MFTYVALATCLLASISARPDGHNLYIYKPSVSQSSHSGHEYIHKEAEEGKPFAFGYSTNDGYGNDFSHHSESDGKFVQGEYRIALPDGRLQIVTYTADHHGGYNADVRYEGEAVYHEPQSQTYNIPKHSHHQQHHQSSYH